MKMLSFFAWVVFPLATLAHSQEKSLDRPNADALKLKPVFNDDFSRDTRSDYTIIGDVQWMPGQLTLSEGSSIERKLDGGSWAKVELDLQWEKLTPENPKQEVRLWFILDAKTHCYVRLMRLYKRKKETTTVALVKAEEKDGQLIEQVVREAKFTKNISTPLTFVYRHGLVKITSTDRELLSAYITNTTLECVATRIHSIANVANPKQFSAKIKTTKKLILSKEEKQLLTDAKKTNQKMIQLYNAGKMAEAAVLCKKVMDTRKRILGEDHAEYASSLNNLAGIYFEAHQFALAEPLLIRAKEINYRMFGGEHPEYAVSINNLAMLYRSKGDYAIAESLLIEACNIKKKVFGEEHPAYGTSLNNLATLYQSKRETMRAIPFLVRALAIHKKALGEEHPSYAQSLNNLAIVYHLVGKSSKAIPLLKKAVELRKKALGEEHPSYVQSLNSLANLYSAVGDYKRAEPLQKKVLDLNKKVFGEKHQFYAQSLSELARIYFEMGEYSRGESLFLRACALQREILGTNHPSYATNLNNLAMLYLASGNCVKAKPLLIKAHDIRQQALGPEHPELATSLNNLAVLYKTLGNFGQAKKLLVQSLEIRKTVNGNEHPLYAENLNNLASIHEEMGEYTQAKLLYDQAKNIREKALGREHPDYASSLNNLASLYCLKGDYALAEQLHIRALDIQRQVLGTNHSDYATSLNNLSVLYRSKGNYARAKQLLVQASDIKEKTLGKEHPDYALCLINLAGLYQLTGEYSQVEPLCIQAQDIIKKSLGENHPHFALCLSSLARYYQSTGRFTQAKPLYTKALDIQKNLRGEQHSGFAVMLSNLACLHESLGDYSEAESLNIKALSIGKSVLGDDHPKLGSIINNLARVYQSKGDYDRAEKLFIRARDLREKLFGVQHRDYATSLSNLGALYYLIGEYSHSESLYLQALEIRKNVLGKKHPEYGESLNNLAMLRCSNRDFTRAKGLVDEALDIQRNAVGTEHPNYARSLNNSAIINYSMGDYTRALKLFIQACSINKKIFGENHPEVASNLNNIAMLYRSTGNFTRSESLFFQARDIREELLTEGHFDYAASSIDLGILYEFMGDSVKAQQALIAGFECQMAGSEKILDSMSEAQAMRWIQENGPRLDLILANVRRAKSLDTTTIYGMVWKSKSVVSRVRVGQSVDEIASPNAKDVKRKLRIARQRLAEMVAATPVPRQAAAYRMNLAEANSEKERLEKVLAVINPATKREIEIRDATIRSLLEHLPKGIAVIDLVQTHDWEFIDHEITIKNNKGVAEKRKTKKEVPTPIYDAFVLRSDSQGFVNWLHLGDAAPIDSAIAKWRTNLSSQDASRSLGTKSIKGRKTNSDNKPTLNPRTLLRKRLWEPLEPHLNGCHTVIILADGALHRLPWGALPGRARGTYLVEDYAIGTASYGQQLYGFLTDAQPSNSGLLVVGGIKYDQKPPNKSNNVRLNRTIDVLAQRNWQYLDGAAKEAETIAKLWNDPDSLVRLNGLQAEEHNVSKFLQKSRFAHLATHGFFDRNADVYRVNLREQSIFDLPGNHSIGGTVAARNPLLMTGIVLAGANVEPKKDDLGLPIGDDGILTAEEIVGLNLRNTELVTLSACETGLGDVAAGEGVFGLQRALHQTGARSVVASLWKVSDKATQALMVEFYKNLWEKKMSKVEALRQAQITMLKQYDIETGKLRGLGEKSVKADGAKNGYRLSPRYWAAFVLSGDWR